jgi:cell shape-determining protein MreC
MRPPGTPYDTLIIDAGKQDGIEQGALVSAGGNSYIGTVSDVYTSTSRVTLFSAPGSSHNVLVMLSSRAGTGIPVSLVGDGAGSMSARIPSATPVSVGDYVVVPGIAMAFAGTVSHVDKPAGDSFETLYVNLPVDLFSLQFVEVRVPAQTGT